MGWNNKKHTSFQERVNVLKDDQTREIEPFNEKRESIAEINRG